MDKLEIYEILVRQNEHMLIAYLLAFVTDESFAKDIAQEAFIRAYKSLHTLQDRRTFPAWLRTIARNVAMDRIKELKQEVPTDPQVIEGMEDIFSIFDDSARDAEWAGRLSIVNECLANLDDSFRSVVRMFYWQKLSTNQIAEQLAVSLSTVLKRLERSRTALRICIEKKTELTELR